MARRELPALRDYDVKMAEMHRRFNEMVRGLGFAFWEPESVRWLSLVRGQEITVDVREHGDEITVVADLPGVEKQDINVRLLDPKVLQISIDHKEEREEKKEEYYVQERSFKSRSRTVFLPADVTEEGVSTSFKNGVLELRFKKTKEGRGKAISIE
ncbi:MAG: Hsp20/alpha crystallin family protein [Methanoregulaceae archaeon]|nr:Hsp20/alpha crystallin family protein [Methanoregulaceae archaeon]